LTLLSFALAVDMLRAADHIDETLAKQAAKEAISELKRRMETENILFPFNFFEQPAKAPAYLILRDFASSQSPSLPLLVNRDCS